MIDNESGAVLQIGNEYLEYEALSYYWGPPEFTTNKRVNGLATKITPTLGKALLRLRYTKAPRWVWCDALCINQNDDQAKSYQVAKILAIVARASRIVVWLGDAHPHTAIALDYLRWQESDEEEFFPVEEHTSASDDEEVLIEIWNGLLDLYSRPWILRVWVQQETYAAKTGLVYCGLYEIDLALYMQSAEHVVALSETTDLSEHVDSSEETRYL